MLVSGATPHRSGSGNSSVFAVQVDGSFVNQNGDVEQRNFFGRVRAVDTSGNVGNWTSIAKTDLSTPLIDSQYVVSLTADKIKAGEIESAAIVLGGANPTNTIIKSKTYDTSSGAQGWYIRGDGHFSLGGPNGITYNNSTITIGSAVQVQANLAADSISVGSGQNQLNINDSINGNVGGMTLGDPTYNYWYANGNFRLGSATNYVIWNGTSLSVKGAITADSGTFTGTVSGSTITGGSININNGIFSVNSLGVLSATGAIINGTINSTSGSIGDWNIDSLGLSKTVNIGGNNYTALVRYDGIGLFGLWNDSYASAGVAPGRITVYGDSAQSTIAGTRIDTTDLFATNIYGNLYGNVRNHVFNSITGIRFPGPLNAIYSLMPSDYNFSLNFQYSNNGGYIYVLVDGNNSVVRRIATSGASDRRVKNNITLDVSNQLQKFYSLTPCEFEYNENLPLVGDEKFVPDGKRIVGLIADEVEELFPDYVLGKKETEYQQVDYQDFTKLLIAASIDQNKRIKQLSAKIDELESRLV